MIIKSKGLHCRIGYASSASNNDSRMLSLSRTVHSWIDLVKQFDHGIACPHCGYLSSLISTTGARMQDVFDSVTKHRHMGNRKDEFPALPIETARSPQSGARARFLNGMKSNCYAIRMLPSLHLSNSGQEQAADRIVPGA